MTVENVDRSMAFYRNVLDFEHVSESYLTGPELDSLTGLSDARARVACMQLGDEELELTEYLSPNGQSLPPDSRSNDHWFQHVAIIVRNMDEAYARLCRFGVERASVAPQRLPDWNASAGAIRAFYFRDPDGHFLEILQFPPGKGHPKWQEPSGAQFLGIDHTAIVVRSTRKSVHFYRDLLGMEITGQSENYGPEQERLNNVPGARLRITTLRSAAGPSVELLEYVAPHTGRPRPVNAQPHDVLHWHTTIAVADIDRVLHSLRAFGAPILSASVASQCANGAPGPAVLVGDPDGHVIELTQLD
jgi:catechol 2,3-dioxygenase-like lactoylglutathione lyase family enzyme